MSRSTKQCWLDLWKRIGAQGNALEIYSDLVLRYAEPHRAYHTLAHIEHCLDEFEQVQRLATNPDAVELAIWFHDAVYEIGGKYNEEKSVALMSEVIRKALLPDELGKLVENLILATKRTVVPADPDAQLLVDIDLSILGQPGDKFDEYERRIRREHRWVPDGLFIARRSAMLKSFLDRSAIFSTKFFCDKYESQARQNIARSLAQFVCHPS
jgi:predicted metal-dependent HD superfamily phosphohydrolase